ncbi:hypothetical protein Nepgr_023869 [Nepenthes gracilis]|uniref:Uncharacterized protein n=1 Tax=Nepenthes gracilis TaxID=150966 RepID=A0AAD3T536_NEPGR|nr:hypothetical protein Nepgr_023869 [Nepenthes gracilis]
MAGCYIGRMPPRMAEIEVPFFVFGDSLFDPSNNNYLNGTIAGQATAWPYGETFFKRATGRLSDGRIVPDFTAEFFRLPIWKPYLEPGQRRFAGGANFASGGAGVLSQTHPGTISLREQLSYFKEVVKTLKQQFGDLQTKRLLTKAVYLFSMGGNDYFSFYSSYPSASQSSQKRFVATVLGNLTQVLEEIYSVGGRKIAFQNVGALGCVPINRAKTTDGSCLDGLSAMARQHNYGLSHSLANLERRLPGFKYSIFDYYHAILDRVNHPKKHGFTNGTLPCCGGATGNCGGRAGTIEVCSDPSKYVWFDGGHTTEACNWQLAKLMWKGKADIVGPRNFKQLYDLM